MPAHGPHHNGAPNPYYGLNTNGNTFYAGAINVAQAVLAADASRHAQGVIILLSDGNANTSAGRSEPVPRRAIARCPGRRRPGDVGVLDCVRRIHAELEREQLSGSTTRTSRRSARCNRSRRHAQRPAGSSSVRPDRSSTVCRPSPACNTCGHAGRRLREHRRGPHRLASSSGQHAVGTMLRLKVPPALPQDHRDHLRRRVRRRRPDRVQPQHRSPTRRPRRSPRRSTDPCRRSRPTTRARPRRSPQPSATVSELRTRGSSTRSGARSR